MQEKLEDPHNGNIPTGKEFMHCFPPENTPNPKYF
jgi:hypothetical protein